MRTRRPSLGPAATLAAIALTLAAARAGRAHSDPADASAIGVALIITPFRADGVTPVLPGTVFADETVYLQAMIRAPGTPNAAVEGGTITLVTPDGKEHDVTPAGGIGCVGGSIQDPAATTNDGRGRCAGAPKEIVSRAVAHTFTAAELAAVVRVRARYAGGFAHIGPTDRPGVGTTFDLSLVKGQHGHTHDGVTGQHEHAGGLQPHEHPHAAPPAAGPGAAGDRPTRLLRRVARFLGLP